MSVIEVKQLNLPRFILGLEIFNLRLSLLKKRFGSSRIHEERPFAVHHRLKSVANFLSPFGTHHPGGISALAG